MPEEVLETQLNQSSSESDNCELSTSSLAPKLDPELDGAPKPEVDIIDGIVFLCWESEEELNDYSRIEERTRREKQTSIKAKSGTRVIIPTKTTDITKIKGWRNKVFATPASSKVYSENRKTTSNFADSQSKPSSEHEDSSFNCDFQENYSDKNGNELKSYIISPACENLSTESSAATNLTPTITNSSPTSPSPKYDRQAKRNYKRNLSRMLSLLSEEDETLEYVKSKTPKPVGRPKKPRLLDVQDYEVVITDTTKSGISEEIIELAFKQNMEFAAREEENRKRDINPSFIMDEQYVRYALSGMETVQEKYTDSVKSLDVLSAVGLTPTPEQSTSEPQATKVTCLESKRSDKEADVTKIISRHSKRDIRLPARYHQSGLLMGSQWVIPEIDCPTKIGKKRLQQEQKRLIVRQKNALVFPKSWPTPDESHAPKLPSFVSEPRAMATDTPVEKRKIEQRPNSILLSNKRFRRPGTSYSLQNLKLHKQRLAQLAQMKRQGVHAENPPKSKSIVDTVMEKFQQSNEKVDRPPGEQEPKYHSKLPLKGRSKLNAVNLMDRVALTKEAKMSELKELYRLLYYENKPERRLFYSQKGIKPRVNKKEVVEEGVQVIQKLLKREQQLEYIKKLLKVWNKKLDICVKVAEKSAKGDNKLNTSSEHVITVVADVLKAYQSSLCYKLSQAIDNKRKELNEYYQQNQEKPFPLVENGCLVTNQESTTHKEQSTTLEKNQCEATDEAKRDDPRQESQSHAMANSSRIIMTTVPLNKNALVQGTEKNPPSTQASVTLKTVNKSALIRPTTLIINSSTNSATTCGSLALIPRAIPLAAQIKMIPRAVSGIGTPVRSQHLQTSLSNTVVTPMITKVIGATDVSQKTVFSSSTRPLSATVARPTPSLMSRPTSATRSIIVSSRAANIRSASLINVSSLTKPLISPVVTSVKGKVTSSSPAASANNIMSLRVSGNTIQVPVISNATTASNGNVVLTYCLKDNKLLPLVPLKPTAAGIPVYKIAHKKIGGAEILPKPSSN